MPNIQYCYKQLNQKTNITMPDSRYLYYLLIVSLYSIYIFLSDTLPCKIKKTRKCPPFPSTADLSKALSCLSALSPVVSGAGQLEQASTPTCGCKSEKCEQPVSSPSKHHEWHHRELGLTQIYERRHPALSRAGDDGDVSTLCGQHSPPVFSPVQTVSPKGD